MVEEKYYDPVELGLDVVRFAGIEAICKCPFPEHDDKHASSSFNMETGLFYCFACQKGLTAVRVADLTGGEVSLKTKEGLPRIKRVSQEWEWVMTCPLAYKDKYLQDRLKVEPHVLEKIVKEFDIRTCGIGIGFPLRNYNGATVGVQIRKYQHEPKYLNLGKKPSIYPYKNLKPNVWVTEGIFGVLNAYKYGIDAISTLGAGVTDVQQELLAYFTPYVAFDNDRAGYLGAAKLVANSGASALISPFEADKDSWYDMLEFGEVTKSVKAIELAAKENAVKPDGLHLMNDRGGKWVWR